MRSQRVTEDWIRDVPLESAPYWGRVRHVARQLGSDGCTGVKDWYLDSCFEHDIHWRLGQTIDGYLISIAEANTRLRLVIQSRSRFGVLSPLSWGRYVGTSIFGWITRR